MSGLFALAVSIGVVVLLTLVAALLYVFALGAWALIRDPHTTQRANSLISEMRRALSRCRAQIQTPSSADRTS